jgi:pantoate--beta-alanine ligase
MIVAKTISEIRRAVAAAKAAGRTVGFVPTMGALHAGHESLIAAAAKSCEFVVVSIFVNPTQFGPGEDFAAYPRTLDADMAACEARGVDAVFAPSVEEMYSVGEDSPAVSLPAGLTDTLCGLSRPGHFAGVCQVVARLFDIVRPDRAFFGQKDFQQTVIVRWLVRELDLPVEIVVHPTVREADGLARSSRNVYLSESHRAQAAALFGALRLAREKVRTAHLPAAAVIEAMRAHLGENAPDGEIDYLRVVDPETLADVSVTDGPCVAALAVRFGGARLIDNMRLDSAEEVL